MSVACPMAQASTHVGVLCNLNRAARVRRNKASVQQTGKLRGPAPSSELRGTAQRRKSFCCILAYKDATVEAPSRADADSEQPSSSGSAVRKTCVPHATF